MRSAFQKGMWAKLALLVLLGGAVAYATMSSDSPEAPILPPEPTATSTPEEASAYVDLVLENSTATDEIVLSRCKAMPEWPKVELGTDVRFVNKDDVAHTIRFSPVQSFEVPKRGEVLVNTGFLKYPGVWNFTCDKTERGRLFIYVK